MLDYSALAAVAAVVREGSFERAAASLGVTRSAVSQRVRTLEERLSAVLVARGQPCVATEAGARLCAHLRRVRLLEGELAGALPVLDAPGEAAARPTLRVAVNDDSLGTWFIPALAAFAARSLALVDLVLDAENHTAERLRTGDVLAAVTADRKPVQGCRLVPLGSLRYAAVASPGFVRRWFAGGITAAALGVAPVLRYDLRDDLQDRWARLATGAGLDAPTHRIPSTAGFLQASLAGVGWSMAPVRLAEAHVRAGRLAVLGSGVTLDVPLYWQVARIGTGLLDTLTRDVRDAAGAALLPPARRTGGA